MPGVIRGGGSPYLQRKGAVALVLCEDFQCCNKGPEFVPGLAGRGSSCVLKDVPHLISCSQSITDQNSLAERASMMTVPCDSNALIERL